MTRYSELVSIIVYSVSLLPFISSYYSFLCFVNLVSLEKATSDGRVTSTPVQEDPVDKAKKANWKARILIALGLILPIVAGVIGVVAWAVNAETVMGRSRVNTSFMPNQIDSGTGGRKQSHSLSFLENRVDRGFGTNHVLSRPMSKFPVVTMRSGITRDFSKNDAISSSSGQSKKNNDDVFFVQYVPNDKKKYDPMMEKEMSVESSIDNRDSSTKLAINKNTDISDLLTKFIEKSKDNGKNSRHSLVFSPSTIKSTKKIAKSSFSQLANNPNYRVQFDEDLDYINPLDGLQLSDDTTLKSYSTRSENSGKSSSQTLGPNRSGEQPLVPNKQSTIQNDGGYSGGSPQNYGGYAPSAPPPSSSYPSNNYGQHPPPSDYPPSSYPAPVESYPSNNYEQQPPASDYPRSSYPAPVESYPSNNYEQRPTASDYPPPSPPKIDYKNDGSYDNDYQESSYVQGYDDHVPSKGLSLHIGGGGGHGLINPISSLSSLLLPSLGKPKVNLNGRVVLGVVLDKGIGLGGNKGLHGGYIG
ncbi:uncharacterized protein LOC111089065 [Limulus polyphemus]|uniref:Uncharacterized protein LOC111089065 n=1 Tax=Limulus polyphemus TaxID=6850 RepID=A0ABM1TKW1_LIMPO|nr:uncharacterized protein LOC111089065 [Limulus polyphemus]